MRKIYDFGVETLNELTTIIANNSQRRLFEKRLPRKALTEYSGMLALTIAKRLFYHTTSSC